MDFRPPNNSSGKPCEFCTVLGRLCRFHEVGVSVPSDVEREKVDPTQGLINELVRTEARIEYVEALMRTIDPNAGVFAYEQSLKIEELYQWERAHYAALCKTAIGCDIEARRVRLEEEAGKVIASVVTGVLADLGVKVAEGDVRTALRRRWDELEAAS